MWPSVYQPRRGQPPLMRVAEAARVTLNARGDLSTGWAIAWRINCWARLHDGDRTHRILMNLFSPSRTYPNLFDAHPPFQIDGNFGGHGGHRGDAAAKPRGRNRITAGLAARVATGSVKGLRARGGFEVDIAWRDGPLPHAEIRNAEATKALVRYGEGRRLESLSSAVKTYESRGDHRLDFGGSRHS
jgi:alpha-L-fucosidase 2